MVNIFLLVTIIALLLWDILSYYGEIPFGDVLGAMVVADLTGLASGRPPPTGNPQPHIPHISEAATPTHPGLHPHAPLYCHPMSMSMSMY